MCVGIVSRADLVRAFNRSDVELEHELRKEVLFGVLVLSPDAFNVTVKDGVVRIEETVRAACSLSGSQHRRGSVGSRSRSAARPRCHRAGRLPH
jgi:hypothetical protein